MRLIAIALLCSGLALACKEKKEEVKITAEQDRACDRLLATLEQELRDTKSRNISRREPLRPSDVNSLVRCTHPPFWQTSESWTVQESAACQSVWLEFGLSREGLERCKPFIKSIDYSLFPDFPL